MRHRLKFLAVVFSLVALLAAIPLVTTAQEELTLETLAERITALTERVIKLEELSAKPELELTDDGCILIQYHEDDRQFPSINAPLIQDKTYLSYRKKFNRNLESLEIVRVDYNPEGVITIYYLDDDHHNVVAEVFGGCEFLDHTVWAPQ